MTVDAWLPVGFSLPGGHRTGRVLFDGQGWQIVSLDSGGRALLADIELAERWTTSGLLESGVLSAFEFGSRQLVYLATGASQVLEPVDAGRAPWTREEALAFAVSLKGTREVDGGTPLHDAIYVERYSRLLPTWSVTPRLEDDLVLGRWLSGGASVPATSGRRLRQMLSWLGPADVDRILTTAGMVPASAVGDERAEEDRQEAGAPGGGSRGIDTAQPFTLPGRPELETFFNEHVVDVVRHRERYQALGIEFPGAVVLHGPPGSGKTFAVERLVDYLGWPSFHIEATSVASPFIHETSRKVAETFEQAMKAAPAVLVIDEMEAFLADRQMGYGHHRVEEVAEFLRRIPEAARNHVMVIAMTNRIEMVDPAILRRGRFDHIIPVGYASTQEIYALLGTLLSGVPTDGTVDVPAVSEALADRPLSDVAFVVREAGRLAARAGRHSLGGEHVDEALSRLPAREDVAGSGRRIGFR